MVTVEWFGEHLFTCFVCLLIGLICCGWILGLGSAWAGDVVAIDVAL